jgi:Na+/phosphate symporter
MLTKNDLNQIRSVVHEEVDEIVDGKLDKKLEPIKKDLTYLKKKINRIDRTLNLTVKNYDEGDVRLEKRVRRIEHHLALPEKN